MRNGRVWGNGRLFQRPRSPYFWCAYCLRGQEYRESTGERDEKKAQKFLARKLKEIHADQIGAKKFVAPKAERLTVSDLLDALVKYYERDNKRNPQFDSHLAKIRDYFGAERAIDVTAEMVDVYIQERRHQTNRRGHKTKDTTINRETQLLGQTFRLAIKRNHLTSAPHIQRLSEKGNARKGFVVRAELDRVIAHLPHYLQDFALFAFLSSWRRSEILSLRWEDIDGDTVRLPADVSKEREARSLALEGELAALITRRQSQKNGVLVFHHDGHSIVDFRKAWATATRMAGVRGKLLHDLRRSGVRDMIRAGVAPHVAMSISGHKTDSMLRRYAIISEADQRAALRKTQEFRTAEEISPAPATGKQLIQ